MSKPVFALPTTAPGQTTKQALDAEANRVINDLYPLNEAGAAALAEQINSDADRSEANADRAETARDDAQGVLPDRLRRDVPTLLADTALTYTAGQPGTVAAGDIIRTRAEGFSYEVAPSAPTDQHVTTAGGVKLYVLPSSDATLNLMAFGAAGDDATDDRIAILRAIDAAHSYWLTGLSGAGGATIVSTPGARHRYSGRIRMRPGVTIDLGLGATGARLIATSDDGGIEQVAGTGLRAELRAYHSTWVGPMHELSDAKSTESSFGRNERFAWFDVGIRGDRQVGSQGIVMSSNGSGGVAWVKGSAQIGEIDFPCNMVANGPSGYVNENWLDLVLYDGVESLRMIVDGGVEIASNRIKVTTQTGANGRSGYNLYCDGRNNWIDIQCWDWSTAKLNPAYDGTQLIFTEASGGNKVTGNVSRPFGFDRPVIVDLAPVIRRNFIEAGDTRVIAPMVSRPILPQSFLHLAPVGDVHDELAHAWHEYRSAVISGASVTGGGATPPDSTSLRRLFEVNAQALVVGSATETLVTVDLGAVKSGSDFSTVAVLFNSPATKPDRCKVDFSTDGSTWTSVLKAGYDGDNVANALHRCDNSLPSFRYVRLTCENDAPRTLAVARLSVIGHGQSAVGGAYAQKVSPRFHKNINLFTEFGGEGIFVNGTRVVTTQRPAIANATDAGSTQARLNDLLAALRVHGLIAT